MSTKKFDPSKLQSFGNAAAGHDGVLSDPTGAVVVKPCTTKEVEFYESVAASHPDLLPHLPTFMGQLVLSANDTSGKTVESGTIETAGGTERLHGKKLATELHIVLENITHGFKKPNILDLKLGSQLWDEASNPEKRARLDAVSAQTTSSSLGFRIAGMKTYKGTSAVSNIPEDLKEFIEQDIEGGNWGFNKLYGRKFSAQDVEEGFNTYIFPGSKTQAELERAREVLAFFLGEVKDVIDVFEKKESRMYGASILMVYEGDVDEYAKTKQVLRSARPGGEDDDDDENEPKLAAVKLIDFAHATWQPGSGPDENALKGMRNTASILKQLLDKTEKEVDAGDE
ncbi:inositol polyphosphate kinase-domain-containing protein [Phaeosphaeriaceae sp. PMI808]|nr:inositol polyphosphate kinase-domain-containing protein [Phaeosphaeriaceae sp. PMI808]